MRPAADTDAASSARRQWQTVVWDDPINTTTYVTSVFQRHFGYGFERARALMLEVHFKGKAVVASGEREHMEAHVFAMHSYGLRATLVRSETAG
ncbi:MAG: ATP-dependent Clp protease adapter ClpS [Actinomycetaceae bacterium]|nr:ATP-dependent Clp protease adapter ClpS [Actinomycetaceae bacterium]